MRETDATGAVLCLIAQYSLALATETPRLVLVVELASNVLCTPSCPACQSNGQLATHY